MGFNSAFKGLNGMGDNCGLKGALWMMAHGSLGNSCLHCLKLE